jgi:hypothetical protein
MKLAGAMLCLALCCLAAASAAHAASVGPWQSFQQRVQVAASGAKTASTEATLSAADYEHYEHAIRVSLETALWRGCGIGGYVLVQPSPPPVPFSGPGLYVPLQFYAE